MTVPCGIEAKKIVIELAAPSLAKAEEVLIRKVLEQTGWNLKRTACLLDVARGTLYSKMEKYNITKPVLPISQV